MSSMFCTLKQAADKLETTEAEVEAMLDSGVLREFRDGSMRLLKVADLANVAVAEHAGAGRRDDRDERSGATPPTGIDYEAFTLPEPEIALSAPPEVVASVSRTHAPASKRAPRPAAKAAVRPAVKTASKPALKPVPRPARKPASRATAQEHIAPVPATRKSTLPERPKNPPRAVVISPPPVPHRRRVQHGEMSLRQWLWTGLIDDSPVAIFIIFGMIVLAGAAAAAGVYALTQAMR